MSGVRVTFHGVRGSTPCCSTELCRFGGNTSCVVIEADGEMPIILDMGTGLRNYGAGQLGAEDPFVGSILLTHLHWDHVQGLPFFAPIHRPGARLDIYGPSENDLSLADAFDGLMVPPYFPICCGDLIGDVAFHDVSADHFAIGNAKITSRPVPHVGATNGYRIEIGGYSVAYVSDHQQPLDDSTHVDDGVLELCDNADLVIHDAQYTPKQFEQRATWGHCTQDYAIEVARQAGASGLALFHHDPDNTDEILDQLVPDLQRAGDAAGIGGVFAAVEDASIVLGG